MKTDFTGKGPLKKYVSDSVVVFEALSNPSVKVPVNYNGEAPALNLIEGEESTVFQLNMNDGLMLYTNAVTFLLSINGGEYIGLGQDKYSVRVVGGQLVVGLNV